MKLTRERVLTLTDLLKNLQENQLQENTYYDFKDRYKKWSIFVYAAQRNYEKLELESRAIKKSVNEYSVEYKQFEDERLVLLMECSDKDPNGQPIKNQVQNGLVEFRVIERKVEFEARLNELAKKYETIINERSQFMAHLKEWMSTEDIDVDVVKVPYETIPKSFTPAQMFIIRPMIKESDEEIEKLLGL